MSRYLYFFIFIFICVFGFFYITNNKPITRRLEKVSMIELKVPYNPKQRWIEIDPKSNDIIVIGFLNTFNKIIKYSTVDGTVVDSIELDWSNTPKGNSMDFTILDSSLCLINRNSKSLVMYNPDTINKSIYFEQLEPITEGEIEYYTPYDTGGIRFRKNCIILTTIYSEDSYQNSQYAILCLNKDTIDYSILNSSILGRLYTGSNFLLGNWCYSVQDDHLFVANPFSDSIYIVDIMKDSIENIVPITSKLKRSLNWSDLEYKEAGSLLANKRHVEPFICKIHKYINLNGMSRLLVVVSLPRNSKDEKDYLIQIYDNNDVLVHEEVFEKIEEKYILASSNNLYIPSYKNKILTYEKYLLF